VKIYIAGKWETHEHIKTYADKLRALGHTITFPWFERHLGDTPLPVAAMEDTRGVRESEVCIFVFQWVLPYSGAMSELGMAIALDKRVIIIGHGGDNNVFTNFPLVEHVESFEEACKCLE